MATLKEPDFYVGTVPAPIGKVTIIDLLVLAENVGAVLSVDTCGKKVYRATRTDLVRVFGVLFNVEQAPLRGDEKLPVYELTAAITYDEDNLRNRAIVVRAYEEGELDAEATVEPVPF